MPAPGRGSLLTPAALAAYLAAQGRVRSGSTAVHETWSGPVAASSDEGQILLPTDRSLRDFDRRLQEALWGVEESFGLSEADLVDAVTAVRADPASTHTGRRPTQVIDFLEEDLRMGHTKRGSFVLTVVARHGETPSAPDGDPDAGDPIEPFSRRVVTTLSRALSETRRAASEDDTAYLDVESVASAGVSLELLQCLLDVSEPEPVEAVDFSFQWATGTTPP